MTDGRRKVAVVGTGFSATAHVEALRRLPGVEVAAIVGRTAGRAREAAARLGVPRGLVSVEDLLADEEIRIVHNCTPNDRHADVSTALLEAGRHVLSEKPLALDAAEAAELARVATASPGVAAVCFNYRHFPLVRQMKETLAAGRAGPLHLVHGSYLQDWLLFEGDWNWRLERERNGPSRALADIGSHWMDLVQYVTGDRIVELCASLGTVHGTRLRPGAAVAVDTEDHASVLLRLASGAQGSFTVSQVSAGRKNRLFLEVDAAIAALAWDQEEPNRLWIGHRDAANEILARDPALLVPPAAALAHFPGGHEEGWADALRNLVADFHAAVAAREADLDYEPSFATFDDGAQVAELVAAALESNELQQWTTIRNARRQ